VHRSGALVLGIERFAYVQSDLLLRVCLRLAFEPQSPTHPLLLVERAAVEHAYPALLACTARTPYDDACEWTWRGSFAVAPELAGDSRTQFALRLQDEDLLPLALDVAGPFTKPRSRRHGASRTTWPYALRYTALLVAVTCQFGLAQGWLPGTARAGGTYAAGTGAPETTPETPGPTGGGTPEPTPEAPPQPPPPPVEPTPEKPPQPPDTVHVVPPTPPPPTSSGGPVADASPPTVTAPLGGPSGNTTAATSTGAPTRRAMPKRPSAPHLHRSGRSPQHVSLRPRSFGPVLPEPTPIAQELPADLLGVAEDGPPAYLIPIYEAAGRRYGVPWRVLAAINAIETDYGRNLAVSSAGAVGWMQFMPATWREWAVDADRDAHLNPYSPQDAIFSAARYLQACGASNDLPGAIFAYNHADWYVAEVFLRARTLGHAASFARVEKGYSLPLDARYMNQLGRTDDGVDIEAAPNGALVYSITPGLVTAVASDPAGFGSNYPVIQATSGSLAGQHIYYGHVALALVHPGQRVSAGQPIAIVGHAGDAVVLGHGHIEIGFSDAGGDPLNHHGAEASTAAGDVMRGVLTALSSSFGIENS
jgi:murein DD-endopeptidase MepM/ murein hydrolase activator NlpD